MPRARRPENKGLPARWRFTRNAYYYQVPPGHEATWDGKKTFRLGKALPDAFRVYADRVELDKRPVKMLDDLFDRYEIEVIPTKSPDTQDNNYRSMKRLRGEFGDAPVKGGVKPQHIYQYYDRATSKASARKDRALLSHIFSKAVEWGIIEEHPFKGEVELPGDEVRDRYIEDWEIVEALSIEPIRKKGSVLALQAYIRMKLLTGMSKGDLLRLTASQLQDDGIHIMRHKIAKKSKKKTIYEWSDELRLAVEMAKTARPVHISPFLFCNKRGQGYVNEKTGKLSGWNSMWQRFMDRVLEETKVTQRFTDHDLRAKCGSDAETREQARALLSHVDIGTTDRFYRRKPERVKPLR